MRSTVFLILNIIQFGVLNCYDNIIFKSFSDPTNSLPTDYWEIYDDDYNAIKPTSLSCVNDKYMGPIKPKSLIFKYLEKVDPMKQLRGEFRVLILNPASTFTLKHTHLDISINEQKYELNSLIITKLNQTIICNGYQGPIQLYQVRLSANSIATEHQVELNIQIQFSGFDYDFAVRKLIFEASYCRWDCESCFDDINICSSCNQLSHSMMSQNNDCICAQGYGEIQYLPLKCGRISQISVFPDRCYIEFFHHAFSTFIEPICKVIQIGQNTFIRCNAYHTAGYPLSQACYANSNMTICLHQDNIDKQKICFNQTTNANSKIKFEKKLLEQSIIIPAEQLQNVAMSQQSYFPDTQVYYLNFSLNFNHLNNNHVPHPEIPFQQFMWKFIGLYEKQNNVIFQLYDSFYPRQPRLYFCQNSSCLEKETDNIKKEVMYFRIFSDQNLQGMSLEIKQIQQTNPLNSDIFDLLDSIRVIQSINDNDQIIQVMLKTNKKGNVDDLIQNDQLLIAAEWLPKQNIQNLLSQRNNFTDVLLTDRRVLQNFEYDPNRICFQF